MGLVLMKSVSIQKKKKGKIRAFVSLRPTPMKTQEG